jgi:predicted helicase
MKGEINSIVKKINQYNRTLQEQIVMKELNENGLLFALFRYYNKKFFPGTEKYEFAVIYSHTVIFVLFNVALSVKRVREKNLKKILLNFIRQATGIDSFILDILKSIISIEIPDQLSTFIIESKDKLNGIEKIVLREDEIIAVLYERFLKRYEPELHKKIRYYYTPAPVVSFMVHSVHQLLKENLNINEGLADLAVCTLDPTFGSANFLSEVIRLATEEKTKKYGEGIRNSFIESYLSKNIYGFEIMMPLYVMGYLNIMKLIKSFCRGSRGTVFSKRVPLAAGGNLFLTDVFENISRPMESIGVIFCNPPYSGHSINKGEWIIELVEDYLQVKGCRIEEKNIKGLQDDYVKFFRFAQFKIHEKGEGIVGFVTNHSYLDNPTFRGMRQSLIKEFNEIYILNLHGNAMKKEKCPDGSIDENVFDIRQGVAISLFIKKKNSGTDCKVFYADIWGTRQYKYDQLLKNDIKTIEWKRIFPDPEIYLFTPAAAQGPQSTTYMYRRFYKLTDIFPVHSVGIVTARDKLTIKFTEEEVYETILNFSNLDEAIARKFFKIRDDTRDWKVKKAQKDIRTSGVDRNKIVPILYRPFDIRYTYYTGKSRGFLCMPRQEVMGHMLQENTGLITVRQVAEGVFNHCLAADTIVESRVTTSNKGIAYIFPLYIYLFQNQKNRGLFNYLRSEGSIHGKPNIHPKIYNLLRQIDGFDPLPSPEMIFYYIYAILHSGIYREKYRDHLKFDFPRIPFTSDFDLFMQLSGLGERLAAVHLMKSHELLRTFSKYEIGGSDMVYRPLFKPSIERDGRVYINDTQYFTNISKELWEHQICGYQVLKKWLWDRKNRVLTHGDIHHYIKICRAIQLTIQYQDKIDGLYDQLEKSL